MAKRALVWLYSYNIITGLGKHLRIKEAKR